MACQRCNSKAVPTATVTISKPNREQGHRGETIEVERELCGPCRTITAAVFPVEGGEDLATGPEDSPSEWEHTGGGWYTHKTTGEKVRGNPDEEEEEETEEEGDEEGESEDEEESDSEDEGGEAEA